VPISSYAKRLHRRQVFFWGRNQTLWNVIGWLMFVDGSVLEFWLNIDIRYPPNGVAGRYLLDLRKIGLARHWG
jgi:hypothetical protein